jgi:hypothetical protein
MFSFSNSTEGYYWPQTPASHPTNVLTNRLRCRLLEHAIQQKLGHRRESARSHRDENNDVDK